VGISLEKCPKLIVGYVVKKQHGSEWNRAKEGKLWLGSKFGEMS
jgi:hypothetical protein